MEKQHGTLQERLLAVRGTVTEVVRRLKQEHVNDEDLMVYQVAMQLLDGLDDRLTMLYKEGIETLHAVRDYDATRKDLLEIADQVIDRIDLLTRVSDR